MTAVLQEEARAFILGRIREQLSRQEMKLPKELELAGAASVSYSTVRMVMRGLAKEGLVRKIPGSGTFILPKAPQVLAELGKRRLLYLHSPYGERRPSYASFGQMMEETVRAVSDASWKLTSVKVSDHEQFLEQYRKLSGAYDGVIYLPPTMPFTVEELAALSKEDTGKLAIVDSELGDVALYNVSTDNRFGGMLAAKTLLEAGAKSLLLVLTEPRLRQAEARMQGFREFAEMNGQSVEVLDCHIGVTDDRYFFAYHTMKERLAKGPCPDGVFAISDFGAFGIRQALLDAGCELGKTVKLIGFDGIAAGSAMLPTLATIEQPVAGIFQTALEILCGNQKKHGYHSLIKPQLRSGQTLQGL